MRDTIMLDDYSQDSQRCFLCGRNGAGDKLDKHHAFKGALRQKADDYGLWVWLCHTRCHIFGADAVHNSLESSKLVQRWAQKKAMVENGWTIDDFRREFGKNYLEEDDVLELLARGHEI